MTTLDRQRIAVDNVSLASIDQNRIMAESVRRAFITVEGDPIRYSTLKNDPIDSDTEGHGVSSNGNIRLSSYDDIKNFRAITSTGGTASILQVSLFDERTEPKIPAT